MLPPSLKTALRAVLPDSTPQGAAPPASGSPHQFSNKKNGRFSCTLFYGKKRNEG